jgi:uncharacterized protein
MAERPHLPGQAAIDSYGNGGFRFADMSHRGSLLCLPSGIWGWDVRAAAEIDAASLGLLFAEADEIDVLVVGSGAVSAPLAPDIRARLQAERIGIEVLSTGAAVRTYNILFGERRRAAAALIAVG